MSTPLNGSLLKGFEVLRLVTRDRPEITAATLQAELGMNLATAHRFLATLVEAGALSSVRRGVYRLSPATAELGRLAAETNPYVLHVQPLIDRLCARLSESVMVCRLGRSGPTCVAVAAAPRPITVSIGVGTSLGLTNTAQGRLWLAEMTPADRAAAIAAMAPGAALPEPSALDEIRRSGFARNAGLAEPDIGAVAVPIRGPAGEIILTLSAFGPLGRISDAFVARAWPDIQRTAAEVGDRLGAAESHHRPVG